MIYLFVFEMRTVGSNHVNALRLGYRGAGDARHCCDAKDELVFTVLPRPERFAW